MTATVMLLLRTGNMGGCNECVLGRRGGQGRRAALIGGGGFNRMNLSSVQELGYFWE